MNFDECTPRKKQRHWGRHEKMTQIYSDNEFLKAVKSTPTSTQDVYLSVGCSRQTARARLEILSEKDLINKFEVAHRGINGKLFIWMLKKVGE